MLLNNDSLILSESSLQEMREGGKIWQKIKQELAKEISVGKTGADINQKAIELFEEYGVEPAFFNYQNFPGHICVSVNNCIIHGVGNTTPLKPEDKITLDIGFKYKSIYIDSAFTVIVDPSSNPEYQKFIDRCYKALWIAIKTVKTKLESNSALFNGDIAYAIENYIKSLNDKNLSLIDGFVGHSIGYKIHQKPHIFNKGLKPKTGDKILPDSVICIEPMLLSQNTGEWIKGKNGFDILSKDPSAFTCHWEHMVLIGKDFCEVITASESELKEQLG